MRNPVRGVERRNIQNRKVTPRIGQHRPKYGIRQKQGQEDGAREWGKADESYWEKECDRAISRSPLDCLGCLSGSEDRAVQEWRAVSHSCYFWHIHSVQVLSTMLSPAPCGAQDLQAPEGLQGRGWWQDDTSATGTQAGELAATRWRKEEPELPPDCWGERAPEERAQDKTDEKVLWKGLLRMFGRVSIV